MEKRIKEEGLTRQGIEERLESAGQLFFYDRLDSTMNRLKELAAQGAQPGAAVAARTQSGGKGRRGRSFYSPEGGIYLSVLADIHSIDRSSFIPGITIAVAVQVCRAVEECEGISLQIKWVNDLFYKGSKVCGILCEGVQGDTGIEAVNIGVGLNYCSVLPDDIGARSLDADISGINKTAARIIDNIRAAGPLTGSAEAIAEYKKRCFILGREVVISGAWGEKQGVAADIDRAGRLVLELPGEGLKAFDSGEMRLIKY